MKKMLMPICYFLLLICMIACKKKNNYQPIDNGLLAYVIQDNFNLKMFQTSLMRLSRFDMLKESGPYTVFAPSDDAFINLGYINPYALMSADLQRLSNIADFHILPMEYDLKNMPMKMNQVLKGQNDRTYFYSKFIRIKDTIETLNGTRLFPQAIKGSNGYLYVIEQAKDTKDYAHVSEALGDSSNFSLFNQAVNQSGLTNTLKDTKQQFTVFVPNNQAMKAAGFQSLEDIQRFDQYKLGVFIKSHIINGQYFVNDFLKLGGDTDKATIVQSLSGQKLELKYFIGPWNYIPSRVRIRLPGQTDEEAADFWNKDILSKNGIIHIINKTLVNP